MSNAQIGAALAAACLIFWLVGAYNRLIRLRGAIARQFAPVDEQFQRRNALLNQTWEVLAPLLVQASARLDALRAATQQVDTACAQARARPSRRDAITSLRLADAILSQARAHLPLPSTPGTELIELNAQLQASDATLAFARGQFNAAVQEYNRAVKQFPTLLIVGLFGFRVAGTL